MGKRPVGCGVVSGVMSAKSPFKIPLAVGRSMRAASILTPVALLLAGQTAAFTPVHLAVRPPVDAYASAVRAPAAIMGRGDKRTKKGKIKAGSFGKSRRRSADMRRAREGPGPDLHPPGGGTAVLELEPELVAEEPVAEAASEPEPEAEAPALKPAEMAARVKELRAVLPKADLKMCKQALDAAGFDFEAVCAAHAVPCRLHAIPHVCVFVCMLYPMSACSCACPCT